MSLISEYIKKKKVDCRYAVNFVVHTKLTADVQSPAGPGGALGKVGGGAWESLVGPW